MSKRSCARILDSGTFIMPNSTDEIINWYTLPYFGTQSLEDIKKDRGQLTKREVVQIGLKILDEIEVVHRAGYVHNDIKLDNIILSDAGFLKIIDFGFATKYYTSQCKDSEVIHTHIRP